MQCRSPFMVSMSEESANEDRVHSREVGWGFNISIMFVTLFCSGTEMHLKTCDTSTVITVSSAVADAISSAMCSSPSSSSTSRSSGCQRLRLLHPGTFIKARHCTEVSVQTSFLRQAWSSPVT